MKEYERCYLKLRYSDWIGYGGQRKEGRKDNNSKIWRLKKQDK